MKNNLIRTLELKMTEDFKIIPFFKNPIICVSK